MENSKRDVTLNITLSISIAVTFIVYFLVSGSGKQFFSKSSTGKPLEL